MDLKGRKVLVVGLARTGISVARFLLEQGARVCGTDQKSATELGDRAHALEDLGCRLHLGPHSREVFLNSELIVVSPGVPLSLPLFQEAGSAGIEVIGDVELFFRCQAYPVVGVTGTDGKTTTVSLIHVMLQKAGIPHWFGGNVGLPLTDFLLRDSQVKSTVPPEFVLVELSSFQLEGIVNFRPHIAAWTNLSEDHLDRYPEMNSYAEAKARIFLNQTARDYALVPAVDPWLNGHRSNIRARQLRFGYTSESLPEIRLEPGRICMHLGGPAEEVFATDKVRLKGRHNLENMMVAAAAARLCGAPHAVVQEVLREFRGLEHRLEFVGEKNRVRFYNDSKATTVRSVIRALEAFESPVLLLAGGKDKGGSYAPLRPVLQNRVRRLVLFGQAADRMARELAGACEIYRAPDLRAAVRSAGSAAEPGDIVLLSPACSSFDMFRDYEDRGEQFKLFVREFLEA